MNEFHQDTPLSDFFFDECSGIYVHSSSPYGGPVDREKQLLLNNLKNSSDLSLNSEELRNYLKDWDSRLFLSFRRANIVSGISDLLKKDSNVLEIGAMCGAVTRYLGENFQEVDAIEPLYNNALIAGYRTHDLGNVSVYCGNPVQISFEKEYDLIVIIGGLDQLLSHPGTGPDPKHLCTSFLQKLTESLSENGMLVLAAQNKLKIKNITGYREPYSGSYYEAVMDNSGKLPVSFNRKEIEQMITDSRLTNYQFYHIFPDYNFTETIIVENDETLSLKPYAWIRTPFEDPAGDRIYGLPESLLLKTFTESGLLWQFSNSFLILASKSPDIRTLPDFLIRKFHNHEHYCKFFHHIVSLVKKSNNDYEVQRVPIAAGKSSYEHENHEFRLENSPYIHGNSLATIFILNSIKDDSVLEIHRTLKFLHDNLLLQYATGETDESGYPLLNGVTIDFVSDNLVVDNQNRIVWIDPKRRLKKSCPVDYILFRNLFYLYSRINPYIPEKDVISFIMNQIKMIYPQYSKTRFYYNVQQEREFFRDIEMNYRFYIEKMTQQNNCFTLLKEGKMTWLVKRIFNQ
jgi:hypothetical protein